MGFPSGPLNPQSGLLHWNLINTFTVMSYWDETLHSAGCPQIHALLLGPPLPRPLPCSLHTYPDVAGRRGFSRSLAPVSDLGWQSLNTELPRLQYACRVLLRLVCSQCVPTDGVLCRPGQLIAPSPQYGTRRAVRQYWARIWRASGRPLVR